MCSTGTLTVLAALSLTACGRAPDPGPGVLIVSAASSLTTVIEPLVQAFERDTGIAVELNLAASSTLASQVLAGAPVRAAVPEQGILGVLLQEGGLCRRRLPVGRAGHDHPLDILQLPAPLDEGAGKIIKQPGVTGRRA